jgi:sarcosine oxidase subunit alpha
VSTTLNFEGQVVPIEAGDTVASALFRNGVRVFSRSFKYHRRRGLYCLTGDCPNCLVNIDGAPCVRACTTPAQAGARVRRENGWPSVDHDLLRVADFVHWLLPVGFYYKMLLRPRWLWPLAEPWLRRVAGIGTADFAAKPARRTCRHRHADVLVIGAGAAGLSAAISAADAGESVIVCDEGKVAEQIAPGPARDSVLQLAETAAGTPSITLLERAPALGIYEGPLVPLDAVDELELIHPARIVVATGAVEQHAVFPGNDLPGVFLARGAARLAGCHRIPPGRLAVACVNTAEGCAHVHTLIERGVKVAAVLIPEELRSLVPSNVRVIVGGRLARADGRGRVTSVIVSSGNNTSEKIVCDLVVLSLGFRPRDGLLRQAEGLPAVGAGDVIAPGGDDIPAAIACGRAAAPRTAVRTSGSRDLVSEVGDGFVCLCEDVARSDLELAWREGFDSTELLKRYTTVGMGPCQGMLCQAHLRKFVVARVGRTAPTAQQTTARPPARPVTLERVAAGAREPVEQRTHLDARHLELGARMEPAGAWRRPADYGDPDAEYTAVRQGVSVMDVGTLGKFSVGGRDAMEFLERLYPCRVHDIEVGRIRYALLLGENGYVIDDGLICALDGSSWYLTFTSGGAERIEAWLHDWAETWQLDVHIVNRTAAVGAINVAGPRARDLLHSLSSSGLDNHDFPYLHHREIEVAGVQCRAIRLGFVGELSYELHHPSSRSVDLWDALLVAGQQFGIRPHGLEALRLLRLEKGHVIVDQDTDYDSTPARLDMRWAVKMDKPDFLGRPSLARTAQSEHRKRLVALRFDGGAPAEGSPLSASGRYLGYLTSSRLSPLLSCGVALGWIWTADGVLPATVESDGLIGFVLDEPAYDPKGARLRA